MSESQLDDAVAFDDASIERMHHFERTNEIKDTIAFVGTLD